MSRKTFHNMGFEVQTLKTKKGLHFKIRETTNFKISAWSKNLQVSLIVDVCKKKKKKKTSNPKEFFGDPTLGKTHKLRTMVLYQI